MSRVLTTEEKVFVDQAWEQYLITTENAVTVKEVVLAFLEYRATLDRQKDLPEFCGVSGQSMLDETEKLAYWSRQKQIARGSTTPALVERGFLLHGWVA